MEKENGGFQWSTDHNSRFEISKLVVIHLGQKKVKSPAGKSQQMHRPKLMLQGKEINAVSNYKYLGIIIDDKLTWRKHEERVIGNATKWVMQCR